MRLAKIGQIQHECIEHSIFMTLLKQSTVIFRANLIRSTQIADTAADALSCLDNMAGDALIHTAWFNV